MRSLSVAFLLLAAASSRASADGFVDFVGGIAAPLGDNTWTNTVETSPKLGVRAGGFNSEGQLGGMLSLDWTPENLDNSGGAFPGGSVDTSGHRFRILVQALAQQHVLPKVSIVERAGAGVDIARGAYSASFLGSTTDHSDTNVGVGFEFGGGVWIAISDSMQLGGELAIPIGYHSHKSTGQNGDIAFDYTSYDLDLLFGVRLWSR
ncbi:MAG: hypothetical protein ACM31C_12265 [Acidobacteriota bacterium]